MKKHHPIRAILMIALIPLVGCSAFRSPSLPQGDAGAEWRATWVLNAQDDIKDAASARQVVEEARSLGLNTIYVAALYRGQAYYPSQYAPLFVPPGTYGPLSYDPIQTMIEAAHEPGRARVQIYAWVSLCNVWQSRDAIPAGHLAVLHPDALTAPADVNRPPDEIREEWLDPGAASVHQLAANICGELSEKYDLDGLLLDGIQYRSSEFGYNPGALQRFALETGAGQRPAPMDPQWQSWKSRQLTQLAARMSLAARSKRPALPIAITGIAEGPLPPTYEQSAAYTVYGQDWPLWMKEGLVDVLVLADFKRQANAQQSQEFRDWLTFATSKSSGKGVVVGLAARDNTILATQNQIERVRENGFQGTALWRYRENNSEGRPRKELFERLQRSVYSQSSTPPQLPWLAEFQYGILAGAVRSASNQPMSNVRVYFPEIQRETYTHGDGNYVLFDVPCEAPVTPGAYWSHNLYNAEKPVTPTPGRITSCDIIVGKP